MLRRSIVVALMAVLALIVTERGRPAAVHAQQVESVALAPGCNNLTLTWPGGTTAATVAAAVDPVADLVAIWRFDAATQRFAAYSPIPNAPNDLATVGSLDAVFVCVRAAATLARPAIGAGGGSTTALVNCDVPDAGRPLDSEEQQMLDALNTYRRQLNLPTLQIAPTLVRIARWKAEQLASGHPQSVSFADHDDPDRSWEQRFLDCGYPTSASFDENLGETNGTVDDLMAAWKASPTHDANMRDPNALYAGIARADAGSGNVVWAVAFGSVYK